MTTDDLERALRELHDDNCMNRMWSPCPLTDEWADCTQLEALRSAAALGAQHRQEQIVAMMRRTAATVLERATSPDDSEKGFV